MPDSTDAKQRDDSGTVSPFAPRKHALSRSERRPYAEVVFESYLTGQRHIGRKALEILTRSVSFEVALFEERLLKVV